MRIKEVAEALDRIEDESYKVGLVLLRYIMAHHDIAAEDAAKKMGVSKNYVNGILRGKHTVTSYYRLDEAVQSIIDERGEYACCGKEAYDDMRQLLRLGEELFRLRHGRRA